MTEFPFLHLTLSGVIGFGMAIAVYLSPGIRSIIFPFNVALYCLVLTLIAMSRLLLPLCYQPRLAIPDLFARVLGASLFLLGIFLIFSALFQLGLPNAFNPPQKKRKLGKEGVYAVLRHPIYLGEFLWCLGWAIIFKASWAILVTPIWLFMLLTIALLEEKLLEREYGEEYRQYKQKVAFFIPGIW